MHGPSGFIQTPGYPSSYPPQMRCDWLIKGTSGNAVTITLTDFELENSKNGGDCSSSDYLQIYDGRNAGAKLLDSICGTVSNNKTYQATGAYMYLKFTSNEQIQWRGFSIHYAESESFYIKFRVLNALHRFCDLDTLGITLGIWL